MNLFLESRQISTPFVLGFVVAINHRRLVFGRFGGRGVWFTRPI